MHLFFAGKVWHFWLAVPLLAAAVVGVVALIVGYLVKVTGAKYPRQ